MNKEGTEKIHGVAEAGNKMVRWEYWGDKEVTKVQIFG